MADKVIRITRPTHTRLEAMRGVLRAMTGRPITQGEVVERALQCLTDSHAGKAWLTGEEAGRAMEARHQEQIVNTVGQLLAAVRPDLSLDGVGFDALNGQAIVAFKGQPAVNLEAVCLTSKGE